MLATSTLNQKKALNMLVQVDGDLLPGVTSKDIVLHICGVIGTAGGTGASIEVASDGARMASDDRLIASLVTAGGAGAMIEAASDGARMASDDRMIASLIRRDDRVCGVGDPLTLDGGTHDDLEYGH